MKKIYVLFLFGLLSFLVACAPRMTVQQKCFKSEEIMAAANATAATNVKSAIEQTQKAIELCPDGGKYGYLGTLEVRQGQFDKAFKYADEALKLQPNHPAVLDVVGWIYFAAGKYDESINFIGRALLYDPNNVRARMLLADIYIVKRDLTKAENEYLKVIQIEPSFATVYYNLGKLYMDELSKRDDAEALLSKYVSLNTANPQSVADARKRLDLIRFKKASSSQ